jgi:ubiquitin carboxyl-terminal hydrolase 5/13
MFRHCHAPGCDQTTNLWLCLACGFVGCGRRHCDGSGGNGHALLHSQACAQLGDQNQKQAPVASNNHGVAPDAKTVNSASTWQQHPSYSIVSQPMGPVPAAGSSGNHRKGHHVCVKLGTLCRLLPPEVYCYACDQDALLPTELPLLRFGIDRSTMAQASEKTLAELTLDQNLKLSLTASLEGGEALVPLAGPNFLTGFRNGGNQCFANATLQAILSTPSLRAKLSALASPSEFAAHALTCRHSSPLRCTECQLRRVAEACASGEYALLPTEADHATAAAATATAATEPLPAASTHLSSAVDEAVRACAHLGDLLPLLAAPLATGAERGKQHDAAEFLQLAIEAAARTQSTPDCTSFAAVRAVSDACSFTIRVSRRCTNPDCAALSVREERASSLSVNVPSPSSPDPALHHSLRELLVQRYSPSPLEYRCPYCGCDSAEETERLASLPQVLVIAENRFTFGPTYDIVKNEGSVVPETDLDLAPLVALPIAETDRARMATLRPATAAASASASRPTHPSTTNHHAVAFQPDETALAMLLSIGLDPDVARGCLLRAHNDADVAATLAFSLPPDELAALAASACASARVSSAPPPRLLPIDPNDTLLLTSLGFSTRQAEYALARHGPGTETAINWLFDHPDDPCSESPAPSPSVSSTPSTTATPKPILVTDTSLPLPAAGRYRLHAAVTHQGGSTSCGHYVAHVWKAPGELAAARTERAQAHGAGAVCSPSNNERALAAAVDSGAWVLYNDLKVALAPFPPIDLSYLLIYVRDSTD